MARNSQRDATRFLQRLLPKQDDDSLPRVSGDDLLLELQRHQQELQEQIDEQRLHIDLLERALNGLVPGVLITNAGNAEFFRSDSFLEATTAQGVILKDAVDTLMATDSTAASGDTEIVELTGPPRKTFEIIIRTLSSTDVPSEKLGKMAVVNDVTEVRRMESVRKDFIANIGHELRTPAGAIAILAETLLDETDHETAQRLTRRLEKEAHRMATMVDDLLSLSQVEGGGEQSFELIEASSLVTTVLDRSEASAELRHVRLERSVTEPGLSVRCDRRQLVSALMNLVDNATKYSGENSTVRIEAERVDADQGSFVEFRVVDQGMGIPLRDRERIFERFYRVDKARARDTGGTGLGLAIVRHVAANHGGEVRVDSLEGMGSTFILSIPAIS
jgi:two-component system, OmpR family, sensor histidine kinase SenX3